MGMGEWIVQDGQNSNKKMAPLFFHHNYHFSKNNLWTLSKFSPDSQPKLQISDERGDSEGPNISRERGKVELIKIWLPEAHGIDHRLGK